MSSAPPIPAKRTFSGYRYKQLYDEYKRDTNAVATWLAASTKFCIPTPATPVKPTGRLKGKLRKLARQQASEPIPTPACKYTITTHQWVPMTKMLTESGQTIDVPLSVITTLKRTISLRKKASQILIGDAVERDAADAESDAMHKHFVGILEQVLGILEEAAEKAPKDKGKTPATPSSSHFSALVVEEPSQAFSDSTDVILPPPVPSDNNTYEAEVPRSWKEILFLFHEMIFELLELQGSESNTWKQYIDGHISLITAALTSRAINDLAAEVIRRYLPDFEEFGGPSVVARKYVATKAAAENPHRLEEVSRLESVSLKRYILELMSLDPNFNYDMGMHTTYHANEGLFTSIRSTEGPNAWRVSADEPISIRAFSEELQYLEDVMDLQRTLFQNGTHRCCMDEDIFRGISRGFRRLGGENPQAQDYPMSFVLWTLLTIKRTFGPDKLATAFERDMEAQIPSLHDELSHLELCFSKIKPGDGSGSPLVTIRRMLEGVVEDARGGSWSPSPILQGRFSLLKSSPSYCGLVLYRIRRHMYLCGLEISHLSSHLVAMAHLNNALEQYGLMEHQWKDMQRCSEVIGFDAMFVGGKPDKSSVTNRLGMALGVSAQLVMALNQGRPIKKWLSEKGPRLATDNLVVLKFFKDGDTTKFPMNKRAALAAIAASNLTEIETVHQGEPALALVPVDAAKQKKGKAKARAVDVAYGESSTSARGETPIQRIIRSLALRIEPEAIALNFPINQFNASLYSAFDLIYAEEGLEMHPLFVADSDYQTAPANLFLWTIFEFGRVGGEPNEVLLGKAASALNKWLAEGKGEAASKREDELKRRRVVSEGESSSSNSGAEEVDALAFWRLSLE